jgi:hypothetical protein
MSPGKNLIHFRSNYSTHRAAAKNAKNRALKLPAICPHNAHNCLQPALWQRKVARYYPENPAPQNPCQPQFFAQSFQSSDSTQDKDRPPLRLRPLQIAMLEVEASSGISR